MSRSIKLNEEICDALAANNYTKGEILILLSTLGEAKVKLWKEIHALFPDLNFTGASVNHETHLLVLPFEEEVEVPEIPEPPNFFPNC